MMDKYNLTILNTSWNGFTGLLEFTEKTFNECIEIMQLFKEHFDYLCEYTIKPYRETI